MHRSDSGDEAQAPRDGEPAEGWFRFGDEPAGTDEDDGRGDEAEAVADAALPSVDEDAGDVVRVAATVAEEQPEERIAPFVVSATPGGVDPDAERAVFAAAPGGGGRGGFGLVGALTVMLALFGAGMFYVSGPRTADAGAVGGGGVWMSDVGEAMRIAEAENKPLVVHFTADWCPPCQAMSDQVFTARAVQDRLARDFVTVRIDLTERGGPNDRIAQQFEVRSIPDIQVYHPGGWQLGQFGYVGSGSEFLGQLDNAVR